MNLPTFRRIQNFTGLTSADNLLISRATDRIQTLSGFQRNTLPAMLSSPPSDIGRLIVAENIVTRDMVGVDNYYWRTLFQGCELNVLASVAHYRHVYDSVRHGWIRKPPTIGLIGQPFSELAILSVLRPTSRTQVRCRSSPVSIPLADS